MRILVTLPGTTRGIYAVAAGALILTGVYLGATYQQIPSHVPLFISPFGEVLGAAPKSIWTVQRLPLMGLLTAGMIALAHDITLARGWTKHGQTAVFRFFIGLLLLMTLKMIPNALSIRYVADGSLFGYGLWLHYLASGFALLGSGLILAGLVLSKGPPMRQGSDQPRVSTLAWAAMLLLTSSYVGLVISPAL